MNDAELARNYILGRLSEDDRAACERRFLFESAFETVMHEQEREVLDDQVNGRLSAADSKAVLNQLAQLPGRLYCLHFAEGLRHASIAAEKAQRRPSLIERTRSIFTRRRLVWTAVVAEVAAAVFIAVSVERSRAPQPVIQSASVAPAPAPKSSHPPAPSNSQPAAGPSTGSAPSTMATFVLLADQQRGAGEIHALRPDRSTKIIRLQLTTEEGLEPGHYSAGVTSASGAKIFSAAHLAPRTEAGRRYIDVRLDAAPLADGDYSVELAPEAASPAQPALHYRFALLRTKSDPAK